MPLFPFKHDFFIKTFFSYVIFEWNNLDKSIRNSESLSIFLKSTLKFIRPSPNSAYNSFSTKGIKHLARLRLDLSHLRYYKFKHRFLDSINRICSSTFDIETTSHFLLHCPNFINWRSLLLNVSGLTKNKLPSCDTSFIKLFLYGDDSLDLVTNTLILNAFADFILSSKRFDGPFYRIIITF